MIQDILVYVIISATLAYVIFSIVNNLRTRKNGGCGSCDGCSINDEFRKSIMANRHHKLYKKPV